MLLLILAIVKAFMCGAGALARFISSVLHTNGRGRPLHIRSTKQHSSLYPGSSEITSSSTGAPNGFNLASMRRQAIR
jgi:hypothetical protein